MSQFVQPLKKCVTSSSAPPFKARNGKKSDGLNHFLYSVWEDMKQNYQREHFHVGVEIKKSRVTSFYTIKDLLSVLTNVSTQTQHNVIMMKTSI